MSSARVAPLSPEPSEWACVVAKGADDDQALVSELGVSREYFAHALDADELPRMETGASSTLVVLRVPVFQGEEAKEPWATQPLGLVLVPGRVIAISRAPHPVLDAIGQFAMTEARHQPRLLLHALQRTAEAYLHEVRTINRRVERLEDQLRLSLENREVLELLKCQKGFVYFATALRSTELLLERLQKSGLLHATPDDADLLEDVRVEVRQALDMTQTSADILSEMMDAFASIISNNLNVVMKFLAAITVILMIPTLIASFYGMNVALPGERDPTAFALIVAISLAVSVGVAVVFVARRWI